jgi:predicted amidohydrolase
MLLKGLPIIPKAGIPIRPIVNWQNVPAYKLAKLLSKLLKLYVALPYDTVVDV